MKEIIIKHGFIYANAKRVREAVPIQCVSFPEKQCHTGCYAVQTYPEGTMISCYMSLGTLKRIE